MPSKSRSIYTSYRLLSITSTSSLDDRIESPSATCNIIAGCFCQCLRHYNTTLPHELIWMWCARFCWCCGTMQYLRGVGLQEAILFPFVGVYSYRNGKRRKREWVLNMSQKAVTLLSPNGTPENDYLAKGLSASWRWIVLACPFLVRNVAYLCY